MSLKEIAKEARDWEGCKHCKLNPEATKPFTERTKVAITPLTKQLLAEMAKISGLPEGCCTCVSLRSFFKRFEITA